MKSLPEINAMNADMAIFAVQATPVHEAMQFMIDNDVDFKVALGAWEGKPETCFVVHVAGIETILNASEILDDQESILVMGPFNGVGREATVVWLDDREPEVIGDFQQATKEEALQQQAYTYDPLSKKYFIVK